MDKGPKSKSHPRSVPGGFYVEDGYCMACGVAHSIAPNLFSQTEEEIWHRFGKKQPETREELDQAVKVLHTQELGCHRYSGSDPSMLAGLPADCCDYYAPAPLAPIRPISYSGPIRFALLEIEGGFLTRLCRRIFRRERMGKAP
jgi:hypothetical protein